MRTDQLLRLAGNRQAILLDEVEYAALSGRSLAPVLTQLDYATSSRIALLTMVAERLLPFSQGGAMGSPPQWLLTAFMVLCARAALGPSAARHGVSAAFGDGALVLASALPRLEELLQELTAALPVDDLLRRRMVDAHSDLLGRFDRDVFAIRHDGIVPSEPLFLVLELTGAIALLSDVVCVP